MHSASRDLRAARAFASPREERTQYKGLKKRKCAWTNRTVAIESVAHKLARAGYSIPRDQLSFDLDKALA